MDYYKFYSKSRLYSC